MSSKSHRLQKTAARMFVYGSGNREIMDSLGIKRFSTIRRWKESPVFLAETERFQAELRAQLPMRMLRLFDYFLDASERVMRVEELDPKNLSMVLAMMESFEKEGIIMMKPPENRLRAVPDSAETVPNRSQNVPNGSEIVPGSA